jgi:hypothetical protein
LCSRMRLIVVLILVGLGSCEHDSGAPSGAPLM